MQGNEESDFSRRMFEYYYRIYDKYQLPLLSLAILTDTNKKWRPRCYLQKLWDCELQLQYPIIKLIDYKREEDKLIKDPNPIAKVFLAHLVALRTRNKPELRFENKLKLVKSLYTLGYDAEYIRTLYNFIDLTMALPNKLEQVFLANIMKHEEKTNMRYINSAERFGMEAGKKEGIKEGIKKGIHSGQCALLRLLLEKKFGKLENKYLAKLEVATLTEIERIAEAVVQATEIEEVFPLEQTVSL